MAWKAFAAREKVNSSILVLATILGQLVTHISRHEALRDRSRWIFPSERKLKYFSVDAVRIWRSYFMHSRGTIETKISDDHFESCSHIHSSTLPIVRARASSSSQKLGQYRLQTHTVTLLLHVLVQKVKTCSGPNRFLCSTQMMWWRKFFAIFVSIESSFQFQLICSHEIKSLKCFAQHFNYKNRERNLKNFDVVISKGSHGFEWNLSSEWENGNVWVLET